MEPGTSTDTRPTTGDDEREPESPDQESHIIRGED